MKWLADLLRNIADRIYPENNAHIFGYDENGDVIIGESNITTARMDFHQTNCFSK